MKIKDIITLLENADALRFEVQDQLLKYVRDKSIPLDDRFKVWTRHIDKHRHPNADIDFVDKMNAINKTIPLDAVVTWLDVLMYYTADDTVRELLIEENFGRMEA